MSSELEPVRHDVVARYGCVPAPLRWVALGPAGGFSGASLWRGDASGEPVFALKAWPPRMSADRLAGIHRLMARASHLSFIPRVHRTHDGATVVEAAGRAWDLTTWMPGEPDSRPTPARLASACAAVAAVHAAWRPASPTIAPCPGIRRRLDLLMQGSTLVAADNHSRGSLSRQVFVTALLHAECELRPWEHRPVRLQPCLCDVWGAHVLYAGNSVTGLIDYGAVKEDHVAVDLARLLGDVAGDDPDRFESGLDAYRTAGGVLDVSDEFVRLLDRTGALCAVVFWLHRLGEPHLKDSTTAQTRLEKVIARVNRLYPA